MVTRTKTNSRAARTSGDFAPKRRFWNGDSQIFANQTLASCTFAKRLLLIRLSPIRHLPIMIFSYLKDAPWKSQKNTRKTRFSCTLALWPWTKPPCTITLASNGVLLGLSGFTTGSYLNLGPLCTMVHIWILQQCGSYEYLHNGSYVFEFGQ